MKVTLGMSLPAYETSPVQIYLSENVLHHVFLTNVMMSATAATGA